MDSSGLFKAKDVQEAAKRNVRGLSGADVQVYKAHVWTLPETIFGASARPRSRESLRRAPLVPRGRIAGGVLCDPGRVALYGNNFDSNVVTTFCNIFCHNFRCNFCRNFCLNFVNNFWNNFGSNFCHNFYA